MVTGDRCPAGLSLFLVQHGVENVDFSAEAILGEIGES